MIFTHIKRRVNAKRVYGEAIDRGARNALEEFVDIIVKDIRNSIKTSPPGQPYTRYAPKRTGYASRRRNPPRNDKGRLLRGIKRIKYSRDKFDIDSQAPYSSALEFGSSKMAARPFMRPAMKRARKRISDIWRVNIGATLP